MASFGFGICSDVPSGHRQISLLRRMHQFRSQIRYSVLPIQTTAQKASVAVGFAILASSGFSQAEAVPITKYFTVNPIQICNDAGTSCASTPFFSAETEKIFAQAGVKPIFLPIKQLNKSSLLTTTGIAAVDLPGNGQHSNSRTINAWFANSLTSSGILYGEAWVSGNGVVINSSAVSSFASGTGRRDTFAHEIGHNFGMTHSGFGAGSANNLMTSGSTRSVPNGVGNITPDGFNLSQLTASQQTQLLSSPFVISIPKVVVDTIGSTPFDSDSFFKVNFESGDSNVFLKSLTVNLAPVNAFFDSTNNAPGLSSSPFQISSSGLSGISASDIILEGGNAALNGKQTMKLNFADNAFKVGDGFRFGVDVDLSSNIDVFGATPEELVGTLFTFEFNDGLSVDSAIDADFVASSNAPTITPTFIGDPTGGPYIPPSNQIDVEEVPSPLPLFGAAVAFRTSRRLRQRLLKGVSATPLKA